MDERVGPMSRSRSEKSDRAASGQGRLDERIKTMRKAGPYVATPEGIVWRRRTRTGWDPVRLANFVALIVGDRLEDDAVEQRHVFELEATFRGQTHRFVIPADRFAGLSWVLDHLGAEAVIYPGTLYRDHLRVAIQMLSKRIPTRHVYTHLGWRLIHDAWAYLHAGGAITANGRLPHVEVQVIDDLSRFIMPLPQTTQARCRAIRAILNLSELEPRTVSVIIAAAAQRAIYGRSAMTVHIVGKSGAGKTAVMVLGQQHFGPDLDAEHLVASWLSTPNALERIGFYAKDTLYPIDDFVPTGSDADALRMHRAAERIIRAQGNQTGRQRMAADTSLRPAKLIRALVISTGEETPRGPSTRARMVLTELPDGALDWQALTQCQADAAAGLYAQATAAHIRWIAGQYEPLQGQLRDARAALRAHICATHPRTHTIIADLALGWGSFLRFAVAVGAMTESEARARWIADWGILMRVGVEQETYQRVGDPVLRYLHTLVAAISAGRAHVANGDGDPPVKFESWGWSQHTIGTGDHERTEQRPHGDRIGWLGGDHDDDLYLEPDASLAVARRLAQESGDPLTILPHTLHGRLRDQKLLVTVDQPRRTLTVRRTLEGRQQSVLHIRAATLWGPSGVDRADQTDKTQEAPPNFGWPLSV